MSGGLQIKPPQDVYTMPDQRISQWISDEQVTLIETGTSSKSFDLALVGVGAAVGFAKDFLAAVLILIKGEALMAGPFFSAAMFLVAAAAAGSFFLSHRRKEDPLKKLCAELRARQKNEFA